jgi:hypothetical protein
MFHINMSGGDNIVVDLSSSITSTCLLLLPRQ